MFVSLIGYYVSMAINILCESGSSFPPISETELLFSAGVSNLMRYFIVSGFYKCKHTFLLKFATGYFNEVYIVYLYVT
jgi:hypothetical protein